MLNNISKGSALILFGSPNKKGVTAKLTKELVSQLKGHYSINIVNAYDENLKPCIACNHCNYNATCFMKDFNKIDNLLKGADLVIVATPVHNLGFPVPLKNIFDRMQPYFNSRFKRNDSPFDKQKTGILLLTCGGEKNKYECEHIMITQIKMIFSILKTKLKYVVTMDNTDFSPNFEESLDKIKTICEELK